MQSTRIAAAALVAVSLGACASTRNIQAIKRDMISEVVSRIKQEVGDFQATTVAIYKNQIPDPADQMAPADPACTNPKNKRLTFVITKVKMDLTVTNDETTSLSASATAPVAEATVGLSLSASSETSNTQTLTFYAYPFAQKGDVWALRSDLPSAYGPITQTLLNLRSALIMASAKGPCFNATAPDDKDENTVSLALSVTRSVGGSVQVGVSAFTFGFGETVKSSTGNTITVSYIATLDPTRDSTHKPGPVVFDVPFKSTKAPFQTMQRRLMIE